MTDLKEHEDSLPEWSTDEDDEEVESKYNWLPYKTGEIPRYVPTETSNTTTSKIPLKDTKILVTPKVSMEDPSTISESIQRY